MDNVQKYNISIMYHPHKLLDLIYKLWGSLILNFLHILVNSFKYSTTLRERHNNLLI
jgi:hypothetical protein